MQIPHRSRLPLLRTAHWHTTTQHHRGTPRGPPPCCPAPTAGLREGGGVTTTLRSTSLHQLSPGLPFKTWLRLPQQGRAARRMAFAQDLRALLSRVQGWEHAFHHPGHTTATLVPSSVKKGHHKQHGSIVNYYTTTTHAGKPRVQSKC